LRQSWSDALASLLTVIAVAGFLLALGRFLDKYHISLKTKDRARSLLIRAFVALDSISIPDLPRQVLIVLVRPNKVMGARYAATLIFVNTAVALVMIWNAAAWLQEVGSMLSILVSFKVFEVLLQALTLFQMPESFTLLALLFCLPVPVFIVVRHAFNLHYNEKLPLTYYFVPLLTTALAIAGLIGLLWIGLGLLSYFQIWGGAVENVPSIIAHLTAFVLLPIPVFIIMVAIFMIVGHVFSHPYDDKAIVRHSIPVLITALTTTALIGLTWIGLGLLSYVTIWGDVSGKDALTLIGLLIAFVLLPTPVFTIMRAIFGLSYKNTFSVIRYFSPLFTVVLALLIVATFSFVLVGTSGDMVDDVVRLALVSSAFAPIVIMVMLIIVISVVKMLIELMRTVGLVVFEGASGPTASPFSYAAALLGIVVLATKLISGLSDK
jgi:hypothetical protein